MDALAGGLLNFYSGVNWLILIPLILTVYGGSAEIAIPIKSRRSPLEGVIEIVSERQSYFFPTISIT